MTALTHALALPNDPKKGKQELCDIYIGNSLRVQFVS